jgi:hypothetical protein
MFEKKNILLISLLCFLLVFVVKVNSQEKQRHTIAKIGNIMEELDQVHWYDQFGNDIHFNDINLSRSSVYKGVKKGTLDVSEFSPDKRIQKLIQRMVNRTIYSNVLDIQLLNQKDKKPAEVRGVYSVSLPNYKRIQLELDYDEILDKPNEAGQLDFYIEIQEKDKNNPNNWMKSAEIRQAKPRKNMESMQILKLNDPSNQERDQIFTAHSYNAVLSNWAGKNVRIVLVAKCMENKDLKMNGRWLNAKLVGATFDYRLK